MPPPDNLPDYFARHGGPPKRCLRCYYVLDHIEPAGRCPECGLTYDLKNPNSFTRRRPIPRWTNWLPGLIASFALGSILYLILIPTVGFGWSTTFAIPLAVGVTVGYLVPAGLVMRMILATVLLATLMCTLMIFGFTGGLCVLVLFAMGCGPILIGMLGGMLFGGVLQWGIRKWQFRDRDFMLLIMAAVLLLAALEGRHHGLAIVSTNTVAVINATPEQTWRAVQFYEQVKHRPPLLLWASPSLRPIYTSGASEHVGDRKVCVYERGRLVKEITEVVPGKRLAFRVVEQTDIEDDGVRLIDGSFDLTPTADGRGTVVTLTTRYEPKLAPRFAYLPAENLAVHTLHGHVLRGMKEDAEKQNDGRRRP